MTLEHCTLGETENDDEDSEEYYDNDLDDYYTNQFDEYESLETNKQFSNEKEESEKVDYTYYLCKVGDCGKFTQYVGNGDYQGSTVGFLCRTTFD